MAEVNSIKPPLASYQGQKFRCIASVKATVGLEA
jgi:hypothetical protein